MTEAAEQVTHGMATLASSLRLHYVAAGEGEHTIVLLHGFPQTWWEWRKVIPSLVRAGYRIIAPDYRGAGHSQRPVSGYDKKTLAHDIHELVRTDLKIQGKLIVVGHDIGLMVAYAFAQQWRDEVSHLVVIDAPLPGTKVFDRLRTDPRLWHFAFHGARDVAEMLISGREELYFRSFFDARAYNPSALDEAERAVYVSAYSAPGALRAGMELYRAFDQDVSDNRQFLKVAGKLTIPVLAVGGEISNTGALMEEMMLEVGSDVSAIRIPRTAHWIAEEAPEALVSAILNFLNQQNERL